MPERIPHVNDDYFDIEKVDEYLRQSEKQAGMMYGGFLKELTRMDVRGKLLEAGSGPGILAAKIAGEYPDVEITGLELSGEMITAAEKYVNGKNLADRIRFVEGSVDDQAAVSNLGKFDLVYSTFSLHHWDDPVKSLKTLYDAVADGGTLFIHDLKRVWWLYYIPGKSGDLQAIRASYNTGEVRNMLREACIPDKYILKTPFPYFWHSLILKKGP